jgi:hypothetical protein
MKLNSSCLNGTELPVASDVVWLLRSDTKVDLFVQGVIHLSWNSADVPQLLEHTDVSPGRSQERGLVSRIYSDQDDRNECF